MICIRKVDIQSISLTGAVCHIPPHVPAESLVPRAPKHVGDHRDRVRKLIKHNLDEETQARHRLVQAALKRQVANLDNLYFLQPGHCNHTLRISHSGFHRISNRILHKKDTPGTPAIKRSKLGKRIYFEIWAPLVS